MAEREQVLSRGRRAATKTVRMVQNLLSRDADQTVRVALGDENLESTPSHPYFVRGYGWTAAGGLKKGDEVLTGLGRWLTVDSVEARLHDPPIPVYNFDVATDHTYFVGDNQVLVHNSTFLMALEPWWWKYLILAIPSELNLTAVGAGSQLLAEASAQKGEVAAGRERVTGSRVYVAGWYREYLLDRVGEDIWRRSVAAKPLGFSVPREEFDVSNGPGGRSTAVYCRPDGVCEHTRLEGSLRTTRVYDIHGDIIQIWVDEEQE